ncbi:MAG: hypothetical protein EAZ35_02190 [Sphingobacteriia bacterium]|nr:MAG: hypothetical protein EAZ35_02190 [Sphingobacteriia bacterium]
MADLSELDKMIKASMLRFGKIVIKEAVIVAVNNNTCSISIDNGPVIKGVLMQSIVDSVANFIRVKPSVGSVVQVGMVQNKEEEYIILQCSLIEEVWMKVGDVEYKINSTKHFVKNGNAEMWDAINLLFQAIEPIIILQGRNPDRLKMAQSKLKFKKIYNGS